MRAPGNLDSLRRIALWLVPSLLLLAVLAVIGPRNPSTEQLARSVSVATATPEAIYPGLGTPIATTRPRPTASVATAGRLSPVPERGRVAALAATVAANWN